MVVLFPGWYSSNQKIYDTPEKLARKKEKKSFDFEEGEIEAQEWTFVIEKWYKLKTNPKIHPGERKKGYQQ